MPFAIRIPFECWRCPLCNARHLSFAVSNNRLALHSGLDGWVLIFQIFTHNYRNNKYNYTSIHIYTTYHNPLMCDVWSVRPIERVDLLDSACHSLIYVKCIWTITSNQFTYRHFYLSPQRGKFNRSSYQKCSKFFPISANLPRSKAISIDFLMNCLSFTNLHKRQWFTELISFSGKIYFISECQINN